MMFDQPPLPGFSLSFDEGSGNAFAHIFWALMPHLQFVKEVQARGPELTKLLRAPTRLRRGDLLHVTVSDLYEYGESEAKDVYVDATLAAVSSLKFPAVQVVFDRTESFNGDAYVLTGANDPVVELGKRLSILLSRAGIPSRRTSRPHMTLAYSEQQTSPGAVEPLSWLATELVLIRSYPGESRYERLGAVPLSQKS